MVSTLAATVASGTRHRQLSGCPSHRTTTAATVRPAGFTRKPSASPTISPFALRIRPARKRRPPRSQVVVDRLRNRRGDAVAPRARVLPDTRRDSDHRAWGREPKIAANKGDRLSQSTCPLPTRRAGRRRSTGRATRVPRRSRVFSARTRRVPAHRRAALRPGELTRT